MSAFKLIVFSFYHKYLLTLDNITGVIATYGGGICTKNQVMFIIPTVKCHTQ